MNIFSIHLGYVSDLAAYVLDVKRFAVIRPSTATDTDIRGNRKESGTSER